MLLNYHIGRLVLSSFCVGDLVWLVLGDVRFAALIYPSSGACDCVDELPHRSSCSQFVVCWRFGGAGFRWCSFCRLKPAKRTGNACYHSVQNLLSSRLLSKNLKIKIYRTLILPVFFMGVKPGR